MINKPTRPEKLPESREENARKLKEVEGLLSMSPEEFKAALKKRGFREGTGKYIKALQGYLGAKKRQR